VKPKAWDTLELPKVLQRLQSFAAFSASKDLALALQPATRLDEARLRQRETSEARQILSLTGDVTVGGAHDVRPQAALAARAGVLEPQQLLDVKGTLIAARNLRRWFDSSGEAYSALAAVAAGLAPAPGLIDAISQALDERGQVLDGASPALGELRRGLRVARDRLLTKLQRTLGDPKIVPMLQEALITQREGRYVIPLRAEFKGKLRSVVHDQSASGATLFVEPLVVVDLNNQVREFELAERDEIRRILAELSRQVGEHEQVIASCVDSLARLDLALARARYAESTRASEPILHAIQPLEGQPAPGSILRLLQARHPLLDASQVVPIDLVLDQGSFALVITGPNTGGKTVVLKTVGLLSLMAQCGLHIPAASGSELSLWGAIHADIGDEQSIEQSLSTFSGHIANIVQILKAADERSLVVLDELGAGTDPQEGSALARAILGELVERRITTLVATHYAELKSYAHSTPGVRNASVEFDLESLRPTYRLTVGLPGRSNALAIAERLGLAQAIVDHARSFLSPDEVRAESLLDEIHRQREAAHQAAQAADADQKLAEELSARLSARLDAIEDERRDVMQAARESARLETEQLRQELKKLSRRLKAAGQPLEAVQDIADDLAVLESEVLAPPERRTPDQTARRRSLRPGDRVHLATLNAEGVIIELGAEQAEVQIGRLRIRAGLDELNATGESHPPAGPPGRPGRRKRPPQHVPPLELDLRGQAVDEALEELDRRLDAAFAAGLPFVRIIHGKGSGRLREAVRQVLRGNGYVTSFEPGLPSEGGDGVTVARLAVG
jgi:DNA mismatch repair protein MutS2